MKKKKDITKLLKENNCKLIGEYKNNREKFLIENEIGYKAEVVLHTLQSKKLKEGQTRVYFNRDNPYLLENMNIYCKNNRPDFKVIRINTDEKFKGRLAVDIIHECGQKLSVRWANFTSKTRPVKCKCNGNYTWTKEEFENYVKEHHENIELLSTLDGPAYLTDVKCKCKKCSNIWTTKACQLLNKEKYHCVECMRLAQINSDLTEEDRREKRDHMEGKEWKKAVYKRDNYICQYCKNKESKPLIAHHKNSWNWDKENRFNIDNGVTLCEKCHKEFHSIYGYGDNTKEQYEKWIKSKQENKEEYHGLEIQKENKHRETPDS